MSEERRLSVVAAVESTLLSFTTILSVAATKRERERREFPCVSPLDSFIVLFLRRSLSSSHSFLYVSLILVSPEAAVSFQFISVFFSR